MPLKLSFWLKTSVHTEKALIVNQQPQTLAMLFLTLESSTNPRSYMSTICERIKMTATCLFPWVNKKLLPLNCINNKAIKHSFSPTSPLYIVSGGLSP